MVIIDPRGGLWPYGGDYDDDGEYGMWPGIGGYGGPQGFPGGGGFYPPHGRPFGFPGGPYGFSGGMIPDFPGMGGPPGMFRGWPPMPPQPEKKKEEEENKGPSGRKAFFLVRQKNSKSGKGWKGYCDHMPAKKNVGQASPPFWYIFT